MLGLEICVKVMTPLLYLPYSIMSEPGDQAWILIQDQMIACTFL